jgi:hypothetical protein
MRAFSQLDKFVFSVINMILFASTIWISSVSALPQQQIVKRVNNQYGSVL